MSIQTLLDAVKLIFLLDKRIELVEECVMESLNYHPIPTDPYRQYVEQRCPDIVKRWNNNARVDRSGGIDGRASKV